jgi:methyl-accepting chemotaxis protein
MDMTIKTRLLGMGALGLAAMLVTGAVGLVELRGMQSALGEANLGAKAIRNQLEADMMHDALRADVLAALRWVAKGGLDGAEMETIKSDLAEHGKVLRDNMAENARLPLRPDTLNAVRQAQASLEAYVGTAEQLIAAAGQDPVAAEAGFPAFMTTFKQLEDGMEAVSDVLVKEVEAGKSRGDAVAAQALWIVLSASALALAVFALFGLLTGRAILPPLQAARQSAARVAEGDLSVPFAVARRDEIGDLMASLEKMREGLRGMVGEIDRSAVTITASSARIAGSMRQVGEASGNQSDAASSVAAAVEQQNASFDRVAERARDSESVVKEAGRGSSEGETVMKQATQEMTRIVETVSRSSGIIQELGDQSTRISEIVGVIREIADQTNLLALNAAIEAARAGEQGRGFAVVADEVRKLAERTAASTGEIAAMIESVRAGTDNAVNAMREGSERVNQGVAMTERAAVSMNGIKQGSDRVVEAVGDISAAIAEQVAANRRIAQDIERIAQLTERNANAVREVVDAVDGLEGQAGNLHTAVARFRV